MIAGTIVRLIGILGVLFAVYLFMASGGIKTDIAHGIALVFLVPGFLLIVIGTLLRIEGHLAGRNTRQ